MVQEISIEEFKKALDEKRQGQLFIDVRTPAEYEAEHIEGVRNVPIDNLNGFEQELREAQDIYAHCQSGNRTEQACNVLQRMNPDARIHKMQGGLSKWKQRELPVATGERKVVSIQRQVQITAGSLIIIGFIFGMVSPIWNLLSAGVGVGFVYAGVTGTCGMANILSKMPWNRS